MRAFWEKVNKGPGCWEWTAAKRTGGYGVFRLSRPRRLVAAHRLAWTLENGDPGDACVLHRCDNPACVRPEHLFLGTLADNSHDMASKGRSAAGTRNGCAKLSEGDVADIRGLHGAGFTLRELGDRFSVSQSNIHLIVHRKTWKHVE